MTIRTTSPAMLWEVLDLYAATIPMKPINVKAAILQHARSQSDVYFDGCDHAPIAAAMYYPLPAERPGERLFELAFVCRPDLAAHLLSFVRCAHLTPRRLANDGPVRVRAHVHDQHLPGRRLARLLGMKFAGRTGDFERWEFSDDASASRCEGKPHGQFHPGDPDALLRP